MACPHRLAQRNVSYRQTMILQSAVAVSVLLLQVQEVPGRSARSERTLTIPAGPRRPPFELRVHANGSKGLVEVTSAGVQLQRLTCDLAPYTGFVEGFAIEDLDMDGNPDLRGVREFGAKWERYCVWLFDPSIRQFGKDLLAQQMELVSNLQVDAAHRRLLSSYIGPSRPSWDVYRIVSGPEPEDRLLLPEQSCTIETGPTGNVAAVVTRYGGGRAQTERHLLPPGDKRSAQEICDEAAGPDRDVVAMGGMNVVRYGRLVSTSSAQPRVPAPLQPLGVPVSARDGRIGNIRSCLLKLTLVQRRERALRASRATCARRLSARRFDTTRTGRGDCWRKQSADRLPDSQRA
jgi:hypothetical protein